MPTLRSHLVSFAISQPRAIPAFADSSTTCALGTGREPGSPRQTGHMLVLGQSGLYAVLHEQYAWKARVGTGGRKRGEGERRRGKKGGLRGGEKERAGGEGRQNGGWR